SNEQFAVREEMSRWVGLEGVGLFDLPAAAGDMHFGLADFDGRELGSGVFENRIVGLTRLAGGQAIGHDCTGAVGEFFVVGIADVDNRVHIRAESWVLSAELAEDSVLSTQHSAPTIRA